MDGFETALVIVVVGARLMLPLLIFKYPLPAILACLVLDGVDQTIFQTLTDLPLDNYQGYDKALDIYYQTLAFVSTMRNWVSIDAFRIGQFLFYYRLIGVLAFELFNERVLLLIFPNTFEYYFIFYEIVRLRWNPKRASRRFWVASAAFIWIVIKLPQEYWIHVAQIDTTDLIRANPWLGWLLVVAVVALLAGLWFLVRPRLPATDHAWRLAAQPLPPEFDTSQARSAYRLSQPLLNLRLYEKVILVSLVSVIFAEVLPFVDVSLFRLSVAIAVVILVNASLGSFSARRGTAFDSIVVGFLALGAINCVLVAVGAAIIGRDLAVGSSLFFILLLTLIVVTYDRYRPVIDIRTGDTRPESLLSG